MHKHVSANTNGMVIMCMFLTIKHAQYIIITNLINETIANKIAMVFTVCFELIFKLEQSYSDGFMIQRSV